MKLTGPAAAGFADVPVERLECMLEARSNAGQSDVRVFRERHRSDVLDVDLSRGHDMAESDDG